MPSTTSSPGLVRVLEVDDPLHRLCLRLRYGFEDRSLLQRALAHRSWCSENGSVESNERLEYLGDSVLGLVVTEFTFNTYGDLSEGALAKIRASVVNAVVLAEVAAEYELGDAVLLGKGEDASGGREKTSILSDSFEAILGAIYLDGGWEPARRFVLSSLSGRIEAAAKGPGGGDYKTLLQEVVARLHESLPVYVVAGEGPDHDMTFTANVVVAGELIGEGAGRTKKQAEQAAARNAWQHLRSRADVREG